MSTQKIPLFLDCDPGHDDAIAIILAAYNPYFNLVGVSTVHGNAPLEKTTYNALSVLTAIGKADEIPVYRGSDRPLVKEPSYLPSIHGESGLEGSDLLPKPAVAAKEDAVGLMYAAANKYPGELAIVATGTFTNVAKLLQQHPDVKSKVRYFSFMGGGINEFNWGAGEFNIWCDPHAANIIFEDPEIRSKCILIPLDLTHQLIASKEIEDQIYVPGLKNSNLRKMVKDLILFFKKAYIDEQGFDDGPPVHDPLAVLVLLTFYGIEVPGLPLDFVYKSYNIHCVESGELEGKSEAVEEIEDGVKVGFGMNIKNFWLFVLEALTLAEKNSTIE